MAKGTGINGRMTPEEYEAYLDQNDITGRTREQAISAYEQFYGRVESEKSEEDKARNDARESQFMAIGGSIAGAALAQYLASYFAGTTGGAVGGAVGGAAGGTAGGATGGAVGGASGGAAGGSGAGGAAGGGVSGGTTGSTGGAAAGGASTGAVAGGAGIGAGIAGAYLGTKNAAKMRARKGGDLNTDETLDAYKPPVIFGDVDEPIAHAYEHSSFLRKLDDKLEGPLKLAKRLGNFGLMEFSTKEKQRERSNMLAANNPGWAEHVALEADEGHASALEALMAKGRGETADDYVGWYDDPDTAKNDWLWINKIAPQEGDADFRHDSDYFSKLGSGDVMWMPWFSENFGEDWHKTSWEARDKVAKALLEGGNPYGREGNIDFNPNDDQMQWARDVLLGIEDLSAPVPVVEDSGMIAVPEPTSDPLTKIGVDPGRYNPQPIDHSFIEQINQSSGYTPQSQAESGYSPSISAALTGAEQGGGNAIVPGETVQLKPLSQEQRRRPIKSYYDLLLEAE